MKQFYPAFFPILLLLLTIGCAGKSNPVEIPKDAVKMAVDFSWEGIEACVHESPEIRVSNVPEGTDALRVDLKDATLPEWNHGGGRVAYDGSGVIPAGALNIGYNGPCPPPGRRHEYVFSVMAMDNNGLIVGFGKAGQPFPPKN